MLIIRKTVLIIISAAAASATVFTTVSAYNRLINSETMTSADLKFLAEQYLFIGILLTLIITTALLLLIFRSRNINNELDKLIRQDKLNPAGTKTGLLRLGSIGVKLNLLYKQIDEVSEMRGLKISALSNAAEFLSLNVEQPMIIIDVTGRIIQVSRGYLDKSGMSRSEIVDADISSVINGIQIKSVLSRLEKKRLPAHFNTAGAGYKWIPLHNKNNEISYIAVIQSERRPN